MPPHVAAFQRQLLRLDFAQDEMLMQLWQRASTTQNYRDTVNLWAYALSKFVLQVPFVIGAADSLATPCKLEQAEIYLHAAASGSGRDVKHAEDELFEIARQIPIEPRRGDGVWLLVGCGSSAKLWSWGTPGAQPRPTVAGSPSIQPVFSRSSSRADLPSYRDLERHRLEWERVFDAMKKHKRPSLSYLSSVNTGQTLHLPVDDATEVTDLQVSGPGELSGKIMGGPPIEELPARPWYRAVILDEDGQLKDCYQYTSTYVAGERFRYWAWSVPGYPDLSGAS